MALVLRQTAVGGSATGTSATATFGSATLAHSFIIVGTYSGGSTVSAASDATNGTYPVVIASFTGNSAGNLGVSGYRDSASGVTVITGHIVTNNQGVTLIAEEWTGNLLPSASDVTGTNSGGSAITSLTTTTSTPNSGVPVLSSGEALIAFLANQGSHAQNGHAQAPLTGVTDTNTGAANLSVADFITSSGSTQSATWSGLPSGAYIGAVVALLPATSFIPNTATIVGQGSTPDAIGSFPGSPTVNQSVKRGAIYRVREPKGWRERPDGLLLKAA